MEKSGINKLASSGFLRPMRQSYSLKYLFPQERRCRICPVKLLVSSAENKLYIICISFQQSCFSCLDANFLYSWSCNLSLYMPCSSQYFLCFQHLENTSYNLPGRTNRIVSVDRYSYWSISLVLPASLQLLLAIVLILPAEMGQSISPKSLCTVFSCWLGAFETPFGNIKL